MNDFIRPDGIVTDEDGTPYRCPSERAAPRTSFCKPHRCDLDEGHAGKHKCDCGWTWGRA
jgi:hypothetical protein